jgi:hypothetical protein
MKLQLRLCVLDGYSKVSGKEIEFELDESPTVAQVRSGLSFLADQSNLLNMLDTSYEHAESISRAMLIKSAAANAKKQAALDAVPEQSTWDLRREKEEAVMSMKKMSCQLDGILKAQNPDYKTADEIAKLESL